MSSFHALFSLGGVAGALVASGAMSAGLDDVVHVVVAAPVALAAVGGALGAMADWSAVYLRDTLHAAPALAAGGFAGFSLAMAAGRLTGDAVVGRFGGRRVLRVSRAVAAGGLAVACSSATRPPGSWGARWSASGSRTSSRCCSARPRGSRAWSPGGRCRPSRRPATRDSWRDRR